MLREKFYAEIILCENQKANVDKNFPKAIMKRSELKSKANRTKRPKDISDYKKQQNLAVRLNKEKRIEYFGNLETSNNSKPFWITCSPIFLTSMHMKNLKLF